MSIDSIDHVYRFWFEELTPEQWFQGGESVDVLVREKFLGLYDRLSGEVPPQWLATPKGILAAIIVLDQFPRNLFRGSARSFESDEKSLQIAKAAVAEKIDAQLQPSERSFLYMPYQHSEDFATQKQSVALFAALDNDESLKFAKAHLDIIERFGRFPHRNALLGRSSTAEEIAFLEGPALFW